MEVICSSDSPYSKAKCSQISMKFVLQREVLLDFVLQVHALQSRGSSKSVTKYYIESHKIIQYTLGNKTKIEIFQR